MRTVCRGLTLALAGALMACAARAAQPTADDAFYEGLRTRGLGSLMEAYLKAKQAAPATTPGAKPVAAPAGSSLALAKVEYDKALEAKIIADRDAAFRKAKEYYEKAIKEAADAVKAVPADKTNERYAARLNVLRIRMALADMIFDKWLKTDLDYLQVTDRRGGDRQRAIELLKVSADQYKAALEEVRTLLSELDHMDLKERLKYENTFGREARKTQREAQYAADWTSYYYAWVLPSDYVPKDKEPSRKQMLDDAVTAFMAYTRMPDRVSAKWYAHLVIGMTYREMGKFDEARTSLALAKNTAAPEACKIRADYELALTLLRQGRKEECRKTIEESRGIWKEKLNTDLYGVAMPLLEAESYILEGKDTNQQGTKDKGIKILQDLHARPAPWPTIVEWVMKPLLGGGTGIAAGAGPEDPFAIWIEAESQLAEAEQKQDAAACKRAMELYKKYAEKVGPKDPNYPKAVYSQAACLLKLTVKDEAARLFQKVADEFPAYQYSGPAARYTISIRGELYEKSATEENRQAYEDALKWFIAKWIQSDPDQVYYYGRTLYLGRKFIEAADAFARVPEKSTLYPESRYWIPECRLEHFRDKILGARDKQLIISTAIDVSRGLLAYVDYAFSMKGKGLPPEKESQLMGLAETASANAAEVFLYPEVELYDRSLPILADMEKKFPDLGDAARGRILKARIEAYQKSGKLKEANDTLAEFLKLAKPDEVGPILRGLYKAMTDDVKALVARNTKESLQLASTQVDQAKALGETLREWLNKSALTDKAAQIENNRYDLAELYLAVGRYGDALTIFQDIGGPQPEVEQKDPKTGKPIPLKEDCIYGEARAHEGLGETAPDAAQGKAHFEKALEQWRVLKDIAEADRDKGTDRTRLWERRYHLFYCKYKLGQKQEVGDALRTLIIMGTGAQGEPLGGKDPVLQQKFAQLRALCATPER